MKRKQYRPLIVFILGPTGAGKSDFAVKLARKVGGEIISCDSMQIYKEMPIMSQQPKPELRNAVSHHLINILKPSQEWSAASFVEKTRKLAKEILRRKHIPIVVGGTGLYARALIKGLFPAPSKDERLRRKLYAEARKRGNQKLYEQLLKIDPLYASGVHPNDLRRIVRALEVYELTGKPISEEQKKTKGIEDIYRTLIFILNRPRKELYKKINERVEGMFSDGIVEEVKKLKKRKMSRTAKAVLGHKEINGYIKGDYDLAWAEELLKKNTRHYAKRQLTWFRKEKDAIWLELDTKKDTAALKAVIAKTRLSWKKRY